jgi:hypothetical protein
MPSLLDQANMKMKRSISFVAFFLVSNVACLVVATLSVLLVWHVKNIELGQAQHYQRHRQAQEVCCQCTPPTPDPNNNNSNNNDVTFSCPTEEGSIDFFTEGVVDLAISDGLCTLVQVAPGGESFKPVGRSYEGYNWEAPSGVFRTLDFDCGSSSCAVDLPTLPPGAVYQLTTFQDPEYSEVEIVARFLEQTTFGPTRADIATLGDSSDMSFAKWVQQHQSKETVPITSHRQFYRNRLNARQDVATQQGAVTHPCHAGARYRRFAFSSKDYVKQIEIETSGTKRIVKVDGFVRTVVEGPVHWKRDASVTFDDGIYDMGRRHNLNKIGGPFFIRHEGVQKNLDIAFGGINGNPPIQFDDGVNPNVVVIIPSDSAATIDTQYFQGEGEPVQEIILTKDLSDSTCASLREPGNPTNPVFSTFNGVFWLHDPRFVSQYCFLNMTLSLETF